MRGSLGDSNREPQSFLVSSHGVGCPESVLLPFSPSTHSQNLGLTDRKSDKKSSPMRSKERTREEGKRERDVVGV